MFTKILENYNFLLYSCIICWYFSTSVKDSDSDSTSSGDQLPGAIFQAQFSDFAANGQSVRNVRRFSTFLCKNEQWRSLFVLCRIFCLMLFKAQQLSSVLDLYQLEEIATLYSVITSIVFVKNFINQYCLRLNLFLSLSDTPSGSIILKACRTVSRLTTIPRSFLSRCHIAR